MAADPNGSGTAAPTTVRGQVGDEMLAEMLATVEACDADVDSYLELRDLGDSDAQIREYLAWEIRLQFCAKVRHAGFSFDEVLSVRGLGLGDPEVANMLRRYVSDAPQRITREQVFELSDLDIEPQMYWCVRSTTVGHERALQLIRGELEPDDPCNDVSDGVAALLGLR